MLFLIPLIICTVPFYIIIWMEAQMKIGNVLCIRLCNKCIIYFYVIDKCALFNTLLCFMNIMQESDSEHLIDHFHCSTTSWI